MRKLTYLACVGDVNSPLTFSGIAYHMLQAGKRAGLFYAGLPLDVNQFGWKSRRILWNSMQLMTGKGRGGYQYSPSFLEKLWQPFHSIIRNQVVLNLFQVFPQSVIDDPLVTKWACIDMTLKQLFEDYGIKESIGRNVNEQAMEQERRGYQECEGIIAFCNWAKRSLVSDYRIDPKKIHVIVPGANIDIDLYEQWESQQRSSAGSSIPSSEKPLELVFVGKYWHRKGLDRLLDAITIGRHSGLKVKVKVLGCPLNTVPEAYRNFPEVEWVDFIDKGTDGLRFLQTVSDADVGVLLSRAEAGGMALREYHALGLAVIGPDVGGATEHMFPEASFAIKPEEPPEKIAMLLLLLQNDKFQLETLRRKSWEVHRKATWSHFTEQLKHIWPYPTSATVTDSQLDVLREANRSRLTFLACVGDVNDQMTFSGIPFHFLQSGQRANVIHAGLPMSVNSIPWVSRRLWWNFKRTVTGKSYGGYQYSPVFLEQLWEPYREQLRDNVVINLFQVFPPSVLIDSRIIKWHCVDMTLKQLFYDYKVIESLGEGVAESAIALEKDAYHSCEGIIALCSWAKESMVSDYGVPEEKIHVIIPGANIDADLYADWERSRGETLSERNPDDPLKLVFVGKYWHRKGLDRLLSAVTIGRKKGLKVTVRVLGCSMHQVPPHLREVPGVEWMGLINKRRDSERFLKLVSDADVGCLLSRAEAVGMSLREYHALGLAVLGPNVGGAQEHLDVKSSWLFGPEAPAEQIADQLLELQNQPEVLARARQHAWTTRHRATWGHFISEFSKIWPFVS